MSLSRGFPSVQFSNAKLFGLPPLLWEMSGPSSSTPAPTTGSRYFRASTTTGIATKKKSTNKTGSSARGVREREEAIEADNNKAHTIIIPIGLSLCAGGGERVGHFGVGDLVGLPRVANVLGLVPSR
ncbi:hypothetical protein JB92DRAFT_2834943 [Gautieria morchelliformis]|nr:hypothetical protein JB92DRAFT_2834943 [Gautieria morchelliformis]